MTTDHIATLEGVLADYEGGAYPHEEEALRAAIALMRGQSWQPIETAPKDGTRLLLWDRRRDAVVSGCWIDDPGIDTPHAWEPAWSWWCADGGVIDWHDNDGPDFWMAISHFPSSHPPPKGPADEQ